MENAIYIKDLHHSYGKKPALGGIDLEIKKGEIFGFVGPNGGGKSTTFRLLASLIPLQKGSIEFFGSTKSPKDKMGIVFQNSSLDKKLTAWENLIYQGNLYGLKGMELRERALGSIERLGLQEKMKERAENLSGGQQRRLEIAKCGLHDPELYLLDEPTTGLDPLVRSEVWQHLLQLREKGKTIVISTHLLEEAEKCDRIALFHQGKVVACGTPAELKENTPERVLSIETRGGTEEMKAKIEKNLSVVCFQKDKAIQIRQKNAQDLVAPLMKDYAEDIVSVKVGEPTLEDLFLDRVGETASEVTQ